MLINNYLEIDHQIVFQTIKQNQNSLDTFSERIRSYLDKETGVATTFINNG
jgi:uncharacterized protein YutE (UPF0331/DUF86 family)